MTRAEIWVQFMQAALIGVPGAYEGHAADQAKKSARLADYALAEYDRRIVGHEPDGSPILENIFGNNPT